MGPNKLKISIRGHKTREFPMSGLQILENGPVSKSGLSNTYFDLKFDDFWAIMGGTPGWPKKITKLEKYAFWVRTSLK